MTGCHYVVAPTVLLGGPVIIASCNRLMAGHLHRELLLHHFGGKVSFGTGQNALIDTWT